MATAFGTNVWLGMADETTYGTYVAPAKYMEITEESFAGKWGFLSKSTLRSPSQYQRTKGKKSVEGGFKANLGFTGFERIFRHALGSNATAGAGPYTHTATLATALPTGLSFHVNRDAANVGSAFKYWGCQISKMTLRQAMEEIAMLEVEVLGYDYDTVAVATPTFPTFAQADWLMFSLEVDGNVVQANDFELTVENNLAADRYALGSYWRLGLGRNGPRKVSGKWTQEFASLTEYNLYKSLDEGFIIAANWYNDATGQSIVATLPAAILNGSDPSVTEAGPVQVTFEFEAYMSSTTNDELNIVTTNSTATI